MPACPDISRGHSDCQYQLNCHREGVAGMGICQSCDAPRGRGTRLPGAEWGSAPAVGGRGATGDVLNGDEALGRVEVVEDAIVADASAPAEAGAFETNDVAGVRVIRHFAERREYARAALRRQSVKLF